VVADPDGLAILLAAAQLRLEWMQRGVDLHGGAEQREAADPHPADVQDDAIEVEEHPLTELDVRAVIAIERRLHPYGVAAGAEQRFEDAAALLYRILPAAIERLAQIAGPVACVDQLGVERVVQLARQHLLPLAAHGASL